MRISDWSSDVCSSDLRDSSGGAALVEIIGHAGGPYDPPLRLTAIDDDEVAVDEAHGRGGEIGNRFGHVPGVAALLHRIDLMETLQRFFGVHDKIGRAHV